MCVDQCYVMSLHVLHAHVYQCTSMQTHTLRQWANFPASPSNSIQTCKQQSFGRPVLFINQPENRKWTHQTNLCDKSMCLRERSLIQSTQDLYIQSAHTSLSIDPPCEQQSLPRAVRERARTMEDIWLSGPTYGPREACWLSLTTHTSTPIVLFNNSLIPRVFIALFTCQYFYWSSHFPIH